jgi:mono/diheme cytochrome c family protein
VGDLVQASCSKCHDEAHVAGAPLLDRGKRLLAEKGCAACHQLSSTIESAQVGPPLSHTGSKVSRQWLDQWLTNPNDYLPHAKMPNYNLTRPAVQALASYLMTFRDPAIDTLPEPDGDSDAGKTVYREGQCIVCHVTKEDSQGNPVGGVIGPDLRKIGNKVNQRWLVSFLKNPHAFQPNSQMPGYHFTDNEAADLAQFAMEEWVDLDTQDTPVEEPESPSDSPAHVERGKLLFNELGCAGCHHLNRDDVKLAGPDLRSISGKAAHELDFGHAEVRHTLPDYLYTKLKSPKAFRRDYQLSNWEPPAVAIWQNLRPAALFSDSTNLPDGAPSTQLEWILARTQEMGALDASLAIPKDSPRAQAAWLVQKLNEVGAINSPKMPDFHLSDEDAEALTIALMGLTPAEFPSAHYEPPTEHKIGFNPHDGFGVLERQYRCRSCHSIRGTGDRLASDLTIEGNRVNRQWVYHYLNTPYSMRRTLTIAMPIFHFPDRDSRFMADYMSLAFVDTRIGEDWESGRERADAQRGKALFDAMGCVACHQLHGSGGDVGPSLTTQVPEFPHGTWVGDKLQGAWIYQWLLDPQALVPDTIEPNLGLSEQEALDLTAYLLTLKNPDFQQKQ